MIPQSAEMTSAHIYPDYPLTKLPTYQITYGGLHGAPKAADAAFGAQGRPLGWDGGAGGCRLGAFAKSKNSVISGCTASRRVRVGKAKRNSTNLRTAV